MGFPVFEQIDVSKCTGCEGCVSACPVQAIHMQENFLGFSYPQLDESKCIHCHLCEKACPVILKSSERECAKTAYAGYAKNERLVSQSSSGGFFGLMAKKFLERGDVIGVEWDPDFTGTHHALIDSLEELPKIQRSKYIQSKKKSIYKVAEDRLRQGKRILFSGCPCEVAAIKSVIPEFLHENLFTIDLVCQGPTSSKAMR